MNKEFVPFSNDNENTEAEFKEFEDSSIMENDTLPKNKEHLINDTYISCSIFDDLFLSTLPPPTMTTEKSEISYY